MILIIVKKIIAQKNQSSDWHRSKSKYRAPIGYLSGTYRVPDIFEYRVPIGYLSSTYNIFIYIGHPISRVFFCKFYNAPDMAVILIIIISGTRYYLQYRVHDNK